MLSASVERYISLRQTMGYRLVQLNRDLKAFAQFATRRGDIHIRICTAVAWASAASTPGSRDIRLRSVVQLALFLHAEDPIHEIPPSHLFSVSRPRVLPYIYSPGELGRIVSAAGRLWRTYPLRRGRLRLCLGSSLRQDSVFQRLLIYGYQTFWMMVSSLFATERVAGAA